MAHDHVPGHVVASLWIHTARHIAVSLVMWLCLLNYEKINLQIVQGRVHRRVTSLVPFCLLKIVKKFSRSSTHTHVKIP